MRGILSTVGRWPVLTGAGLLLSSLLAQVALLLSVAGLTEDMPQPLAPYALAALPSLAGLWLDWSRLWRPSGRVRFWSAACLLVAALLSFDAALRVAAGGGWEELLLAPSVLLAMALIVQLVGSGLRSLARPDGPRPFGLALFEGRLREVSQDSLVLVAGDSVVRVARSLAPELSTHRTFDQSPGAPLSVLGRFHDSAVQGGAYRSTSRFDARSVLDAAPRVGDVHLATQRRTRAWVGYLTVLALGSSMMAATLAY